MKHVSFTKRVWLLIVVPFSSYCMETQGSPFGDGTHTNHPLFGDFLEKTLHVSESTKAKVNFVHTYAINWIPVRYGLLYAAHCLIPLNAKATFACCVAFTSYDAWYWNDKEPVIDNSGRKSSSSLNTGKQKIGVTNVSFSSPRFKKVVCGYMALTCLVMYGFYHSFIQTK